MATAAKKAIQYSYVKPMNKLHVKKMALKTNRTDSEFVDELISAHRLKRSVKFDARVPKGEEKVKMAREKRKQKIAALGK